MRSLLLGWPVVDSHSSVVAAAKAAKAATEELEEAASASVERRRRVEGWDGAMAANWLAVCSSMWVVAC
jgi:hypothetical protein